MTKTKFVIITIILLMFILGTMTYIEDLNSVTTTVTNVDYTIQTAVDMSIDQSITSDDFYLDGFNYGYAGSLASRNNVSNLSMWTWGSVAEKNLLDAVIKYKNASGGLSSQYDAMRNADSSNNIRVSSPEVFKRNAFLFQYNDLEFKNFYTSIKNSGLFKTTVYKKVTGNYQPFQTCTLDLMGLSEVSGSFMPEVVAEDTTSIEKDGAYGKYMLTPTALGITYIDKDILIPILKSNLERMCATAYMTVDDSESKTHIEQSHRGCIDDKYLYYNQSHKSTSSEYIVNNGTFEIDLNSVDVSIEYRAVDMYNSANNDILNEALGAKANGVAINESIAYSGNRAQDLYNAYESRKPASQRQSSRYIVVAKIDFEVTIHIPYNTPLLQLYRGLSGGSSNHLDIMQVDSYGNLNSTESGVKYSYTVYTAVTP